MDTLVASMAPAASGLSLAELEALVPRLQRSVYRLLLGELGDADLASSLTSECFLRAVRARARFRGECSPEGWVLRIALNLARDQRKSKAHGFWRRLLRLDAPHEDERTSLADCVAVAGPNPELALLQRESVARVGRLVARLPARQREVFHLRFVEELPLDEIAALLDIAVGSVKSHLSRAVAAVRHELESPGELP